VLWQRSFFTDVRNLELWAGPFCNIANLPALETLWDQGFSGAFVSPELGKEGFITLGEISPIPLGVVVAGNWPLAISRIVSDDIKLDTPFESPMQEQGWVSQRDGDFWVFPGWRLDLTSKINDLTQAGYTMFVTMEEPVPKGMSLKQRPGLWNWDHDLL